MANSTFQSCSPTADNAFGPVVQGCRGHFDFTLTFEHAFFSIAPSAALLLAGGVRLPVLFFRRQKLVNANPFKWLKVATIGVFVVLQLALVVLWAARPPVPAHATAVAAAALSFVASLVLCALSPLEHARSFTPSAILCSYLLLSLVFDAVVLRTLWLSSYDSRIRALFTTSFALKGIIMLLEAKEKQNYVSSKLDAARSPEEFSGVYGKSFYWWMNSLIRTGYNTILNPEKLYPLRQSLRANRLDRQFQHGWSTSTRASKNKLSWVLITVLKWPILAPVIPKLVNLAFTFAQPLLLQRFLSYLQNPQDRANANTGYGLIGAYFLVYFGMAVSSGIYWLLTWRSLTMLRGVLVTAVYQKTTTIALTAIDNGKAMTLMSTDAERIVRGVMDFHELWSSFAQIGIATWLLETQLGLAAIGPIAVCFVSIAATVYGGTITNTRQMGWIMAIQQRIGITSSVLGAMKSIRLSGFAVKVTKTIHTLRLNEIQKAKSFWLLGAYTSTIGLLPQMLSPVITFAIFTANAARKGETLDFSRMFTSLALLILLTQPLFNLFAGIIDFVAALGCLDRINQYLVADSRVDLRTLITENGNDGVNSSLERTEPLPAVVVKHGTFSWAKEENGRPTIEDINFSIPQSSLTFLIGPVASGKSTLLKAILGEVTASLGEVSVLSKEIAFCDQTPWLMNASIRANICAFSSFQQVYYHQIIRACALEPDFKEMPKGDDTEVGSKGISLSSGQKQRIALARALYSKKSIMFFDDILSQLDGPTQRHIVAHLFRPKGLLRESGVTVLLATHAISYLPLADNIIVLDANGSILEEGPYSNLLSKKDGYVQALHREHKIEDWIPMLSISTADDIGPSKSNTTGKEFKADIEGIKTTEDVKDSENAKATARVRGDFGIYVYYLSCLGSALTFAFFLFQVSFAFFTVFPNIWLKWWADSNTIHPNAENARYVGGYAGLQVAGLISSGVLTWFCFNIMAQKAGLQLHTKMLNAIMKAPMSLFSVTDSGSITTKFSQDFQLVDSTLPLSLMSVVTNLFITIGQAGLIASASGWIALSFPVLIAIFYFVQRYYLRTSRQMRHLDLEQKAPLYTQFTESIEGIATLRAFSWQSECILKNYKLVDNSQRPYYLMYMLQKWLSLVLDLIITALAVLVVGISVALKDSVSVGYTGVSLSQIISLTSYMKLIILFWTQMETSLGAVSRLRSFSEESGDENLPEENQEPPRDWPKNGSVEIEGLSVVYRTKDSVHTALKDITLSLPAGEKIGICGRTGSGKTTLLLSLLKLVESEGRITIDNINISTISRELLRERIITVSDEAFFFPESTLRENIDPTGLCSDDALLQSALTKVMLWDAVSKGTTDDATNPLDAVFSPDDLSHGQKQLFALARAIVRHEAKGSGVASLVILDEATSRTDKATDAVIQRVIRDSFKECTLLVIAHRLESILDFDKVVVLEKGKVVENDKPATLREREGSVFRRMLGGEKEEASE